MKFGDKVRVSAVLRRNWANDGRKEWKSVECKEPQEGVFLGNRTLSNGRSEYWPDEGCTYFPKEYFKASLVIFNERQNPVYVALDKIVRLRT